jgi:hypothetical protein
VASVLEPVREFGQYFVRLNGATTVLAALPITAVIAAGAPERRPTVERAARALQSINDLSLVGAATAVFVIAVLLLGVGLALQPLQFGWTQVLEGYWGKGRLARSLARASTLGHLETVRGLEVAIWHTQERVETADNELDRLAADLSDAAGDESVEARIAEESWNVRRASVPARIHMQECSRLRQNYPVDKSDLMPTKLGNRLRRFERLAGAPYGFESVTSAGIVVQTVDETLREYYDDTRTELDLAARMTLLWVVDTIILTLLLWQHDFWLLAPLATCLLAIASYRGCLAAAEAFGEALQTLFVLGRSDFYRRVGWTLNAPRHIEVERNRRLCDELSP